MGTGTERDLDLDRFEPGSKHQVLSLNPLLMAAGVLHADTVLASEQGTVDTAAKVGYEPHGAGFSLRWCGTTDRANDSATVVA